MNSPLINTIWFSEKRKNLLLFLKEGAKDIEDIKTSFNVTSRSVVPSIKELKNQNIVVEENGLYELSNIGELIVENMQDLLNIALLVANNPEYWENRDLSSIP